MKTTFDIPDTIYRRVKAKSAIEGRAVRDVAIALFTSWLNKDDSTDIHRESADTQNQSNPPWFASLHKYAANARGNYDMETIRRNIANGRNSRESTL